MKEEKRSTPKLRFPGFEGDWEMRKLSDIYQKIGNAFVGTATPYYVESGHFYLESNNVKDGQINHNTEVFINDEFYERQKDKWLHTGDMVMVQSGHVGHAAVIPEELDNTAAHALIMFRSPIVKIDPYFLNYQYQTLSAKKKIENITTGNTIKHILASDMQEFVVDVTSYEEQLKVAGCFQQLDNRITLHQRKLDQIKEYKKGMLQKMFPKKGETVPEVRFPGFEGDWEERKLGELAAFSRGTGLSWSDISEDGQQECILYGNLYTDYGMIATDIKYRTNTSLKNPVFSNYGDVLIPGSDTTPTGLARATSIEKAGVLLGGDINIVSPNEGIIGSCLSLALNANKKELIKLIKGTTVRHIYNADLKGVELSLPNSSIEQEKIVQFFKHLDNLITLHQRKIDQMKEYKKGLLQQMFV